MDPDLRERLRETNRLLVEHHTHLYICPVCSAQWEQLWYLPKYCPHNHAVSKTLRKARRLAVVSTSAAAVGLSIADYRAMRRREAEWQASKLNPKNQPQLEVLFVPSPNRRS